MGIKTVLYKIKWLPTHFINIIRMGFRGIKHGRGLRTYGVVFFRGTGTVKFGTSVIINSCLESNPIGGDSKTIIYAKGKGRIIIGDNVGISNSAIVAMDEIRIDDDVFIGGGCRIYDHDFHSIQYEDRILGYDNKITSSPIHIKKGAFIGAGVIILKGVSIGTHSIIGAGAVVTKSIPDNEIWAGNPARFVKKVKDA